MCKKFVDTVTGLNFMNFADFLNSLPEVTKTYGLVAFLSES